MLGHALPAQPSTNALGMIQANLESSLGNNSYLLELVRDISLPFDRTEYTYNLAQIAPCL